jgi:selenide,water dikinase
MNIKYNPRLTHTVSTSGFASKIPFGDLSKALRGLNFPTDPNVLIGLDRMDDAGVYKISPDMAMIQSVDFLTPIVDDPFAFGQIAAASALSDIYAMGGTPKTAMNLVSFPVKEMDISILRKILEGGNDKMKEANVALVGGHSVVDDELKYGLSVTGFVHPDRIFTKNNIQHGDQLILTKPLGIGIINTALKGGTPSGDTIKMVTHLMAMLNKEAADVMKTIQMSSSGEFPVHACTDISGYGLLGHIAEMVIGTGLGIKLIANKIPVIPQALDYASMGLVPAEDYLNREACESMIHFSSEVDSVLQDVLFDPQTSGGLLIAVNKKSADDLVYRLVKKGMTSSAVIGEVTLESAEKILVS